jgi:branched-chain amino acid aminotransferase
MINADFTWVNGKLVPFAEATTHVGAFTLHYGVAVFEGIRCYKRDDGKSAVFRLREHIDRMFESAQICAMDIPYTREQLQVACADTLRANKHFEAYVRPLVFVGAGALGLGTRDNPIETVILTFPWKSALGEASVRDGVRAHISSFVRGHLNTTMSKGKISGQYVTSILAKREAQRLGFDEGIMLDAAGRVAEATAENIFMLYRGRLYTPPLDSAILDGITRDSVIVLAKEAGLEVVEQSFTRDMLYGASEVIFTGTAAEVTPVREIDGRPIGNGKPGPVTRQLQAAFLKTVRGPGEPKPAWLYYI